MQADGTLAALAAKKREVPYVKLGHLVYFMSKPREIKSGRIIFDESSRKEHRNIGDYYMARVFQIADQLKSLSLTRTATQKTGRKVKIRVERPGEPGQGAKKELR